ncbi:MULTISPECIES: M35 family metallo-endopeptidase [unclassified Pseudoxanthomonas]|uniref:M35 family metallo-endopeptidase n=1 Tax=unclassified Pseudoxanthomonas TaxID=2645906 RepID=UPI003077F40E
MKSMLILVVVLASSMIGNSAFAAGRLEAKFSYPMSSDGRRSDTGRAVVVFSLRNTGDAPVAYSVAQLPVAESDGYLTNNVLRITDLNGEEAPYIGMFVSYSDRGKSTTRLLQAGEIRTATIDILKNYELHAGRIYNVELRFGAPYAEEPEGRISADSSPLRMKSGDAGSIKVRLDPNAEARKPNQASEYESKTPGAVCSSTQQSDFQAAKAVAFATAEEGVDALSSGFVYDWNEDYTDVVVTFPHNARFWRWFGPRVNPVDPDDPTTNDAQVDLGIAAIYARMSDDQSIPKPIVTAACDCTAEQESKHWIAYVIPTQHYVVHTCSSFYAAEMIPTGSPDSASKVGTLLHEVSHFSDSLWSGTSDIVDPVTQLGVRTYDGAISLAATDKPSAVRNATNFEFYLINYDDE